jgi:Ca2+-dependent lipid-binding protein
MVALNYQSNDESMCLQYGLFSDNGGCGYLLKPSCLLPENQSFDPKEKVHKNGKHIKIHIISGQNLPKEKNVIKDTDIVDPYVEISTFGIRYDNTENRTPSVRNNGLNPIWDYKINLDIYCPELCLVKFQVRDEDRYGRSTFLGQSCIPFTAIQPGYRHIKLKAKNGDYIHGTLFVHIKIDDF